MKNLNAIHSYNQTVTDACERVLATLIRRLGPWRESIFLVGGITPRYLIKSRPPAVPAHPGTGEVAIERTGVQPNRLGIYPIYGLLLRIHNLIFTAIF